MIRPCLQTHKLSNGMTITPGDINILASGGERFTIWILENSSWITGQDIVIVAEAIKDNWKRFYDSC